MSQFEMTSSGKSKKKSFIRKAFDQWDLQILVFPAIIFVLIFNYIPMYGMLMAFQEFKLGDFPGFSEWVGIDQFSRLLNEKYFYTVLRNTFSISLLKLIINFPLPILFALMLNEIRGKFIKKSIQTISYLPHFISWVVAAKLMFDFLSPDNGAINDLLVMLNIIDKPIAFFNRGEYFWGIAVITDLWKELGWNSIIFYAAIASVDTEMFEAADIDGATRIQKIWYITLSSIKPTIVLLFIFTVGGIMNANFDQIMMLTNQMGNALVRDYADVIDTYVYRIGISQARFSYASAAGLLKSSINFFLLLSVNKIADKVGDSAIL